MACQDNDRVGKGENASKLANIFSFSINNLSSSESLTLSQTIPGFNVSALQIF